jgi:sirohydrochlorin ferrochelatase
MVRRPQRPLAPVRELVLFGRLYARELEEQVREAVDRARSRHPAIEWVVVPRLGAEPDVARAVVARALETLEKVEG